MRSFQRSDLEPRAIARVLDEWSSVCTDLWEGSQRVNIKLTTGERTTTEDRTDNQKKWCITWECRQEQGGSEARCCGQSKLAHTWFVVCVSEVFPGTRVLGVPSLHSWWWLHDDLLQERLDVMSVAWLPSGVIRWVTLGDTMALWFELVSSMIFCYLDQQLEDRLTECLRLTTGCWSDSDHAVGCVTPKRARLCHGGTFPVALFWPLNSINKKVTGVVSGWTTCDINTRFCTNFPVSMHCRRLIIGRLLQWTFLLTLCTVLIMVGQPFCAHGRLITFVALGLTMGDAPPFRWVRQCCFQFTCRTVATRWTTSTPQSRWGLPLTEGKREGAVDFFNDGDLNIELKLDIADDEHRGLWTVFNGTGCTSLSAEEAVRIPLLMRKIEVIPDTARLQLHRDQHLDEHWWQLWVPHVASSGITRSQETTRLRHGFEGHTLYDLVRYVNQVRSRTWDHLLVITKIEGRELKTKRRVKGWARWAPVWKAEKAEFQEHMLSSRSTWNWGWIGLATWQAGGRCCRDQSYHDFVKEQE